MNYVVTESPILAYEWISCVAFLVVLVVTPQSWLAALASFARRFPILFFRGLRTRWLTAVAIVLGVLLLNITYAALAREPSANIHDEFAYQLAGQTFAAGRLTNPSPPFSEHFESFHILVRPTYQAKYPPAQGLVLAFGQSLMSADYWGVWFSHAAVGVAIFWMLLQYLPHRWAAAGAFLFVLSDRLVIFWGQTYWGGAVPAIASGLLFGGFGRFIRDPDRVGAVALGCGAGLFLISRPFEGFFACLCVIVGLAVSWRSRRGPRPRRISQTLLVAAIGFAPFAAFFFAYNQAVTGSPVKMPYVLWSEQYGFTVRGPNDSGNDPEPTSSFLDYQQDYFEQQTYRYHWTYPLRKFVYKLRPFYLPGLTLLALGGFRKIRSHGGWTPLAATIVGLAVILAIPTGGSPHYLAPVAAPIALAVISGIRTLGCRLRRFRPGVAYIIVFVGVWSGIIRVVFLWPNSDYAAGTSVDILRQGLAAVATENADKAIIFWNTGGKIRGADVVYNGPTPLQQKVIWARYLGQKKDAELMAAIPDYQPFMLSMEAGRTKLKPYHDKQ